MKFDDFHFDEIKKIKENFPKEILKTPLDSNKKLSKKYNSNIFIKREDLQEIRSYKIRGAFNSIYKLEKNVREKGVVCASAGNHSQGFAYICNLLKIKGHIFMPKVTPKQKINATKKFGGKFIEVTLFGDFFDEASESAEKFCKENDLSFIHPFDNINTIKGQATCALEIIEDFEKQKSNEKIDYFFCPIGGGGFISGVSQILIKKYPNIKIIGVESKGAPAGYESLKNNKVITLDKIDTFSDGIAVKHIGNLCFDYIKKNVSKINLVDENRICVSILDFLNEEGIVSEPAGIISIDSLKDFKNEIKDKNVVCVLSGGNLDFQRILDIEERALKFLELKKYYIVQFPQRSGALKEFLNTLGEGDDIERFEYLKKTKKEWGSVLIGVRVEKSDNFKKIEENFNKLNWDYEDITKKDLLYNLLI